MENENYRRAAYAMIYLAACAVSGKVPSPEKVAKIDLNELYSVSGKHFMRGITAAALASAGVKDSRFVEAGARAVRNSLLFDREREAVLAALEREQIWYMPLKGIILKKYYPKVGMREMSDNDILFDETRQADVRRIMEGLGFRTDHYNIAKVDVYMKQPVFNFEMHRALFNDTHDEALQRYYADTRSMLVKDEESGFGYRFTDEGFYLFMLAHEYKHFCGGGTGIRSLLDTYVFLRERGENLDPESVKQETDKLGITDFERNNRELAQTLFSFGTPTAEQKALLDYYIFSGTYGNIENSVRNKISNDTNVSKSKKHYVFRRFFPDMKFIKTCYPFFYKHKFLLPALFVYRLGRGVTVSRKKVSAELSTLKKIK